MMDNSGSPALICAVPWGNTSVKSSLLLINTGVVRSNPASRIAGISKEIIVIEAGEKSGSLTTAKLALDYNREVYVVPGNITSEVSRGCNLLAKQGANILTSVEDMKEIVGIIGEQVYFA